MPRRSVTGAPLVQAARKRGSRRACDGESGRPQSSAIAVTRKKECYQDGVGVISSSTETMTAGNLIAGGVVGLAVDAASGAMNTYNEVNQIAMVPIAGCKPGAGPKA